MSSTTLCKWVNERDCKCSHHYVWMSKEMWNYVMWVQSIEQSCLYEMKEAMWLNEHWGEWVSECAFLCACTHNHLYSHTCAHAFTCSQTSVLRACVWVCPPLCTAMSSCHDETLEFYANLPYEYKVQRRGAEWICTSNRTYYLQIPLCVSDSSPCKWKFHFVLVPLTVPSPFSIRNSCAPISFQCTWWCK